MSDLQCPATLLVLDGARASAGEALNGTLAGRQVMAVYAAGGSAQPVAQALAEKFGAPCDRLPDGAVRRALDELSDLHRGETVVVVGDAELVSAVAPGTAAEQPVELLIDADGWLVRPLLAE